MRASTFVTLLAAALFASRAIAGIVQVHVASEGRPIDAATVSLLKAADSAWLRSEMTDAGGQLTFKGVLPGKYIVATTAAGFQTVLRAINVADSGGVTCDIELQKISTSLDEVAINGKRPFMEMTLGKTVVNIEGSTVAGTSTVLELLRRLPGVTVDPRSNISMRGKEGVLVLVDDRPTYLDGDDLIAYLSSLSADEVAQLELITQPGAQYDAAGSAGIINIKLRKNKKAGWNGNLTAGYGNGFYFNRHEGGTLNYKKDKLNFSVSANDKEAIGFADWLQQMSYLDHAGAVASSSIIHSTPRERFANTVLSTRADCDVNSKTTIGASLRGTYHPNVNKSNIFIATEDANGANAGYTDTRIQEGFIRKDVTSNVYLTRKFNADDRLDINADYLTYTKKLGQYYVTTQYDNQMQSLPGPIEQSDWQPLYINVYSGKADYMHVFKNKVKIETGVKTSVATIDNDVAFKLLSAGSWIKDTTRSNHFVYSENINAAYISASKTFGKWELKVGLRAEQTAARGLQYVYDSSFTKSYISLFPTAYADYKMDSSNTFEFNYGRRINRPRYGDLNPYVYFSFQNNYNVGNPQLMPEFTNSIEIKHSYRNMLISTLGFSNTGSVMQGYMVLNDSTKTTYLTERNIATNNSCYLNVAFEKDIWKVLSFSTSGSVSWADFGGELNGARKTVEWIGYSCNAALRLDAGRGWKAEASGFYTSSGKWSLTSVFQPMATVDFGVSKKVNEQLTAKFYANDPFYTFRLNSSDYSYNFRSTAQFRDATKLLTLSVTWNFGGKPWESKQVHTIEESGRIN